MKVTEERRRIRIRIRIRARMSRFPMIYYCNCFNSDMSNFDTFLLINETAANHIEPCTICFRTEINRVSYFSFDTMSTTIISNPSEDIIKKTYRSKGPLPNLVAFDGIQIIWTL
jgi:hypothetical protein